MESPRECYEIATEFPCTSIDPWLDAIIHVFWQRRPEGGDYFLTLFTLLAIVLQASLLFPFMISYVCWAMFSPLRTGNLCVCSLHTCKICS